MKHYITYIILMCACFFASAQKIEEDFFGNEIALGLNSHGDTIKGTEALFPYKVLSYDFDSSTHELVMVLRSTKSHGPDGYLALYDLHDRYLRWANEISGNNFDFVIGKDRIIQNTDNRTTCIDRRDGNIIWEKKGRISFGDIATTRNINNKSIVLSADGVYYLNLAKNPDNIKPIESDDDITDFVIANTAGVSLGALTGTFVSTTPTTYQDIVYDNHSNVVTEAQHLYFASSKMLYKIDATNGKRIWETELPPSKTSNSTIHIYGDIVLLVNNGYAMSANNGVRPIGDTYIASFNKTTGKLNYLHDFYNHKPITTSAIINDELVAVSGNFLYICDPQTGELLGEKDIRDLRISIRHQKLLDASKYYVWNGKNYVLLQAFRPNTIFLRKDDKTILCIDEEMEVTGTLDTELWENYWSSSNIMLIRNKDRSLIIRDGKQKGSVNISTALTYDNTIIDIDKNHLRIAEVDDIFN